MQDALRLLEGALELNDVTVLQKATEMIGTLSRNGENSKRRHGARSPLSDPASPLPHLCRRTPNATAENNRSLLGKQPGLIAAIGSILTKDFEPNDETGKLIAFAARALGNLAFDNCLLSFS